MKRITKSELADIITKQDEWKYNRQVKPELLNITKDDQIYSLEFTMDHHHRSGNPCEAHARTVLLNGNGEKSPNK